MAAARICVTVPRRGSSDEYQWATVIKEYPDHIRVNLEDDRDVDLGRDEIVQVGGSKVTEDRISGPPSRMLPALRDLGNTDEFKIKVEIDTDSKRVQGTILRYTKSYSGEELILAIGPNFERFGRDRTCIDLSKIIAFRVLTVESA